MIHLNPVTQTFRFSVVGRFSKGGYSGKTKHQEAGGQGCS
jgi:hypothetical protein